MATLLSLWLLLPLFDFSVSLFHVLSLPAPYMLVLPGFPFHPLLFSQLFFHPQELINALTLGSPLWAGIPTSGFQCRPLF